MWLLNTQTLSLEQFDSHEVPPYAILSHRWEDEEEVTFTDLQTCKTQEKKGYKKMHDACGRAATDGFRFIWIDTCCIDKTNETELNEAINSMYIWYRDAEICYAFLDDSDTDLMEANEIVPTTTKSSWFKRNWTLQELVSLQHHLDNWISFRNYEIVSKSASSHVWKVRQCSLPNTEFEHSVMLVVPMSSRCPENILCIECQPERTKSEGQGGSEHLRQQISSFWLSTVWTARSAMKRSDIHNKESLSRIATISPILLASATAATSVFVWSRIYQHTLDMSEQIQVENSMKSLFNDSTTKYQVIKTFLEAMMNDRSYRQIATMSSFVTYAMSLVYLTNRKGHSRHKTNIMMFMAALSSIICLMVRARDDFMSSMLMEFLPIAFISGEVASLLLVHLCILQGHSSPSNEK